jgi:hypothetical protein
MKLYSLVGRYQCFWWMHCLHLHSRSGQRLESVILCRRGKEMSNGWWECLAHFWTRGDLVVKVWEQRHLCQSLQKNSRIVLQARSQPFPSWSFPTVIHKPSYHPVVLHSDLLTLSLHKPQMLIGQIYNERLKLLLHPTYQVDWSSNIPHLWLGGDHFKSWQILTLSEVVSSFPQYF